MFNNVIMGDRAGAVQSCYGDSAVLSSKDGDGEVVATA